MAEHYQPIHNWLRLYRKQNGLSQKEVARLLGLRTSSPVSRYERGIKLPNLKSALKLEIVYHTPVAFLFQGLYQRLRGEIRARERTAMPPDHEQPERRQKENQKEARPA